MRDLTLIFRPGVCVMSSSVATGISSSQKTMPVTFLHLAPFPLQARRGVPASDHILSFALLLLFDLSLVVLSDRNIIGMLRFLWTFLALKLATILTDSIIQQTYFHKLIKCLYYRMYKMAWVNLMMRIEFQSNVYKVQHTKNNNTKIQRPNTNSYDL